MLGNYFYNERIRKAVAVFGSLFNDIYVQRKDASGGVISQIKVPLSYAPKRDFVDRIAQTNRGEDQERQIAIKLPRMSFEILAISYDPTRQLPKLNKRTVPVQTNTSAGKKVYTPVPYNIQFQLNIYARSQDDALQVVEQILPSFNPQYSVSVKPLDGFDLQEDTPIKLDAVTFQDDFEGVIEQRRTIIYTLDFEMKINLYRDVNATSSLIKSVEASLYDFDTGGLLSYIQCDANTITGNTSTITEDIGVASERLLLEATLNPLYRDSADADGTIQKVTIGTPFSIVSGDSADNGTSTITGAGNWTYTPNVDFYGIDTFDVTADVGQNVTEKVTVTVTVNSVDDAFDDTFALNYSGSETLTMNVASNDLFETAGTITHSIELQPAQGTVTIIDATAGTFLYTPPAGPFGGVVTWEYRATPDGNSQKSEVASVQITVTDTS
jgi:hypothetical protein